MSSVSAASSVGTSVLSAPGGTQVMGKDDFLKLLVTQLQNQDPLNPSDPTEFTAQLAQFSSLEQLFEVNASIGRMASATADMERMSAMGLIGKEVISQGGAFRLGSEGAHIGYRLDASAKDVFLHVLNPAGQTVATIPGTVTGRGEHFFHWDGKNQYGDQIPPGDYALVLSAVNEQKQSVPGQALIKGSVTGIDLSSTGSVLVSNSGDFRMKDIVRVSGG